MLIENELALYIIHLFPQPWNVANWFLTTRSSWKIAVRLSTAGGLRQGYEEPEILREFFKFGVDIVRASQAEMKLDRGYVPMEQLKGYIFVYRFSKCGPKFPDTFGNINVWIARNVKRNF